MLTEMNEAPLPSVVQAGDGRTLSRAEFLSLLKTYNCFLKDQTQLHLSYSQGDDGEVVVEGFLNISWGVQRLIRLKIQDDKQIIPFAPLISPDPTSPVSPTGNKRGMTRWGEYVDLHQIDEMAETLQDTIVNDPLSGPPVYETTTLRPVRHKSAEVEAESNLFRCMSDASLVKRRRGRGKSAAQREKERQLHFSINGHFYNYKAGTSVFTPSYGTPTKVRISSRMTTNKVIEQLLNKFKIENDPQEFALYCIHQSGEKRKLSNTDQPLWERILQGPSDEIMKIFLMDVDEEEVSDDVAQYLNLELPILEHVLLKLREEENREIQRVISKSTNKAHLTFRFYIDTIQAKILWDFQIQTAKLMMANQTDIALTDKQQKTAVMIDVAIHSNCNISATTRGRREFSFISCHFLMEGDVALSKKRNAMKCWSNHCKWQKSYNGLVEVPYRLSDYFYNSERASIKKAMETFHKKTCIRFVPHQGQPDYLSIESELGTSSSMCLASTMSIPEASGTAHAFNFDKKDTNNLNTPYDYSSVMHYGSWHMVAILPWRQSWRKFQRGRAKAKILPLLPPHTHFANSTMPGLLSSPVCLTVIWFLSWSLRPSRAQIWTDEGKENLVKTVSDVRYGHLESNVTLACGKSQPRGLALSTGCTTQRCHGTKWTSDGALVLLHADHSAQGNYSCYDDQGLLLHSVRLRLGRPPGLLSISCQVPNHTHVRCSWVDLVKTFLPANYDASFGGSDQGWRPCLLDVARKHCDVYQPPFWQATHTLRIIETNGLGSETTYARVKLHDLLKPDPPESVSVKEIEGYPKRLNVSWDFPSSWPVHDAFPLIFHIRYRPQGSMYWSEIYSEESPVVISDALAGHLHHIQVRAHDEVNSESQWSEWSPLLHMRPWEAFTTPEPTEETFPECYFPCNTKPETSTAKSHNPVLEDEGNLGLVILLVLFSVVILTTVLSLIFVVWVRQRRREHGTKQELTSMVKMKSMPI
ncbi:hypothetical protein L3Q82_012339 [Scortum barcoo]|uniref:Uncharacterized protein n=1 Tax=Scortum barcoo TaxID=214431 RepID=A0ACB8W2A0_9TELE|nr:hypothetical protein L3Q82_012339 [Scortum barcoo]